MIHPVSGATVLIMSSPGSGSPWSGNGFLLSVDGGERLEPCDGDKVSCDRGRRRMSHMTRHVTKIMRRSNSINWGIIPS